MPNWCDNFVKIEHKNKTAIKRIEKAFKASKLCAEFIPIPKKLEKAAMTEAEAEARIEKYGYKDWYDFCVSKWGTKWDVGYHPDGYNNITEQGDRFIYLNFSSAWSPPIGLYEKLSSEGYHVRAYYYEGGCAFTGIYDSETGDDCYSIPETSAEIRKQIPEELDDMFNISESMEEFEKEEAELEHSMGGEK